MSPKRGDNTVPTHFAPPERDYGERLRKSIDFVCTSETMDTVMRTVNGLVAVLNDRRQILGMNRALIDVLGLDGPGDALGLRPGEALPCGHSRDMEARCGTSRYCVTCGAKIAHSEKGGT